MGMDIVLNTELRVRIYEYNKAWVDNELAKRLYRALDEENFSDLIDIINDGQLLLEKMNREKITLEQRVEQLEQELEQVKAAKTEKIKMVSKSNAYRDDLDTEEMWKLYQEYKTYSKVGKLMGCDGKTVKRRLSAADDVE